MNTLSIVQKQEFVIDLSHTRPALSRMAEVLATSGAWLLWMHLMMPFWQFFASKFYFVDPSQLIILSAHFREITSLLAFCARIFVGISAIVLGWAAINYVLDTPRRRLAPVANPITQECIASSQNADLAQIKRQWNAKRLVIVHNDEGKIHQVVCLPYGPEDRETVL